MKNLIYLLAISILFIHCSTRSDKVEKLIEQGVEVIINHLEPYIIEGEPTLLTLEKEFSIDFARATPE